MRSTTEEMTKRNLDSEYDSRPAQLNLIEINASPKTSLKFE